MARKSRALSGAAKTAYLKRAIRAADGIDPAAAERLAAQLNTDIASLSLRDAASEAEAAADAAARDEIRADTPAAAETHAAPPDAATASRPETAFDPFSPNVVVVIRTRGRDAVLAELDEIRSIEQLRLLAREQQLSIAGELATADDIRHAIVAAAERRIANRRAAAS